MMSEKPSCPGCHSPQAVQPVAAIVAGRSPQIRLVVGDQAKPVQVTRTNLPQLFAPPQRPAENGWLTVVLGFGLLVLSVPASCLVTSVIVGAQGQVMADAFASGAAERVFAVVISVAVLVVAAVFALILQARARRQQPERSAWQAQMARWNQAHYCHRCNATFVPGSAQTVPPEQFRQSLAH